MSTTVTSLIDQALNEITDKDARRTSRPDMLGYYNRVQEKLSIALRCLQSDYYFDLVANEPRYYYPEDAIQIAGIRIARTSTPTALGDYYWLDETFVEEYRAATQAFRPAAIVYGYHARAQWFELLNSPVEDVVDGGIVSTWHIPDRVTAETPSAMLELRDFLRGKTIEGMTILSRIGGRERAAAQADWERWMTEIQEYREKIEDPSDDRRDSLRPPGGANPFGGMR